MSGTSTGKAPARPSVRRARRGLFVYLALVLLLSAPVEGWMLGRGLPIGQQMAAVYLLMWIPAIASFAARLLLREGFADVSFRPGARGSLRWCAVALLFPVPVGLVSYGLAWKAGLVPFVLPPQLGGGPATAGKFLIVLLAVATVGTVASCLSALGEEIGWRGYMVPRLVEAELPQPVLLGGIAWAAWHLPLILSGQYAQAGNPLVSASLFVLVVVAISYLFARVRLETGSVWPAVLLHASWNAVIQGAFDPFTGGANRWTGESGILTVAVAALLVFLLCRGRWTARTSPKDPAPRTLGAALLALALVVLAGPALAAGETAAPGPLPIVRPESVAMSTAALARIDAVVESSLARKEAPGAVVLVGRHGKVVYRRAFGHRALVPSPEPMTVDTVFDMASVTKVAATATSILRLVEEGRVRLADPVGRYLPGFAAGGGARAEVTVEQLLTHRAGLPPDDPMSFYVTAKDGSPDLAETWARKNRRPLDLAPGSRFVYSDAGFEVLGELVRAVTGEPLDAYAARAVFAPLGMRETEFRPVPGGPGGSEGRGRLPVSRIAPCEPRDGRMIRGTVHDPRAFAVGGVAGHAGLFSTADDMALYCAAILAGGGPVLSPATVAAMTRPYPFGDRDLRGLGWDVDTHFSSCRGDLFPVGSFGHTGWTGTSLWLDPTTDVFVVILANRVHPDGSGNVVALRSRVATAAAAAVTDVSPAALRAASEAVLALEVPAAAASVAARSAARAPAPPVPAPPDVRPGVELLEAKGFAAIAGKRVALLTNRTGRTRDGRGTASVLLSAAAQKAGVRLVRLFSPEHGLFAEKDEKVPDGTDAATGLPVVSLYGEKRRPSPSDLEGLDAVVVDLQDAGTRFYTYLTSVGWLMEEAAKAKVAVVVLDRPDPIGGVAVEGPPADPSSLSFTAVHTIPIRPGMTLGEVAKMVAAERSIPVDLSVVSASGWRRSLFYDETGLPWVPPSPNLRTPGQALLYPGVALLETTNVSVGRGTDTPFEVVGAPWLDAAALARTLSGRRLPGLRFVEVEFTPASSTHAGKPCRGVRIAVVDRAAVKPVALGLELACALRDLHPREWDRSRFGVLLAHAASIARFERGEGAASIESGWAAALMEFERRRGAYLLYPD